MKKFRKIKTNLSVLLIIAPLYLFAGNTYPIVLVHGFLGWGKEEMKDYYYWGGDFDLEAYLQEAGFEVYSVSVGPLSSNYDRAIETFYQIKGGQLDYGKEHSAEFNLVRKPEGKNYPGLYPQWDEEHPIHIIGHSMGGTTARMLEYLLKNGSEDETSSLLGSSHVNWIKSITTISTPHNGTTLEPILYDLFPYLQKLIPLFGGLQENGKFEKYYDFDLEQWGLERLEDEKINDYLKRLKDSPITTSNNFCSWDLSPAGAQVFNTIYRNDPEVYYFSFATCASRKAKRSEKHIPASHISWRYWYSSFRMGRSTMKDSIWFENDGVVNTISMHAPFTGLNGPEPQMDYDGTPVSGVWQFMGKIEMDHHSVVGHGKWKSNPEPLKELFIPHCKLLYGLD